MEAMKIRTCGLVCMLVAGIHSTHYATYQLPANVTASVRTETTYLPASNTPWILREFDTEGPLRIVKYRLNWASPTATGSPQEIRVGGIPSTEAFGSPTVRIT
jgi:hypothetical protein